MTQLLLLMICGATYSAYSLWCTAWLPGPGTGHIWVMVYSVSTAYSVQHTPYSVQRTAYSVLSSQWYAAHVEPRTPYAPLPIYSECCGYECYPHTLYRMLAYSLVGAAIVVVFCPL